MKNYNCTIQIIEFCMAAVAEKFNKLMEPITHSGSEISQFSFILS